jgi:hypothetical protein
LDLRKQIVFGEALRRRRDMSTQNFDLGTKISQKVIKEIFVVVKEWKLQLVNVVTFCSEFILRNGYNYWKVAS